MTQPEKRNVLGVLVSATDRETAVEQVLAAARAGQPLSVTALAVHGVMSGNQDRQQRMRLNDLDLVVADGQPVRWGLNLLYGVGLSAPVRGTDLTLEVLAAAERERLPVYFYGSTPETLNQVVAEAARRFPGLPVAGHTPSRFGKITEASQEALAGTLRDSGAAIVFVGLGCPRQETFVYSMCSRVGVPMIAVGAAFDYIAGSLREPPAVLRRVGLEWAWRLALEPRRLWRRYALNPVYLGLLGLQSIRLYRPAATRGALSTSDLLDA